MRIRLVLLSVGVAGFAGLVALAAGCGSGVPNADALTCPGPASYAHNGGACGSERWTVKTGTDTTVSMVDLTPQPATIAGLVSLPVPAYLPSDTRVPASVELETVELDDVTLGAIKLETDSDYHMILDDGLGDHLIAEIPYPGCASNGPFACDITRARAQADRFSPTPNFSSPNATVSVIGVGFFDFIHGQTGVAPNGIEIHPVLAMCIGAGCDPRAD
jgi:hypothetical protein